MVRWKLRAAVLITTVATIGLLAGVTPTGAGPFFNSAEPGCDGSNSNVLMCDDFEHKANGSTPGEWYSLNCDAARNAGGIDVASKGWCGTIYANPITPAGAVNCGSGMTPFGSCAATSGQLTGAVGGRNMADHSFPNKVEFQEIYVRWYYKPSPGFAWSGQKVMTFNRCCAGSGGIFWAGLGYNIGTGSPSTSPPRIGITNNRATNQIYRQNQGNDIAVVGGRWFFYELHIRLNTPGQSDGVWRFWANDCGTSGTGCTGTPTLRASYANINWGRTSSNGGIGSIWWENWANAGNGQGSIGQEWYDQIKVSRVGPIGFAGGGGAADVVPPAPPTGPVIR